MKILIDGQTLHKPERFRGIGRYFISVLKNMIFQFPQNTYLISSTDDIDLWGLPEIITDNVTFLKLNIDFDESDNELNELKYKYCLDDIVINEHIDIFWNPNPLMINTLFSGRIDGCINIATVHDLIPLVFPQNYLDSLPMNIFENYMNRLIRLSSFNHIFAVSYATRNDLINFTEISERNITVLYEGIESYFFDEITNEEKNEVRLRYGLPKEFIFTIGGSDFRKNNNNLINAFAILIKKYGRDIPLVLGSAYDSCSKEEINSLAIDLGIIDKVMFIGSIPDGDLKTIYALSKLFVFPSLYEGFGLPVLEAMATGTPVVASNSSSIPEVLGDAGFYFDPYNVKDIALKIEEFLADVGFHKTASKASIKMASEFNWNKPVEHMLEIMEKCLNEKYQQYNNIAISVSKNEKIKLAIFSPLNPQPSGIADYSEELLVNLKKYAEIDLFVDNIIPSNPDILNKFKYYDYREFDEKIIKNKYDNIIYNVGNNTLHEYIYITLTRHPGVIVLHDINIHPFLREITFAKGNIESYLKEISDSFQSLGKFFIKRIKNENYNFNAKIFPIKKSIQRDSKAIIVHSKWAKNQIEHLYDNKNIYVVPMGVNIEPEITQDELNLIRKKNNIPDDMFIISCFGDIINTKRIDVILKAFSIFRLFFNNTKLLIVGNYYHDIQGKINKLIERYRLKESLLMSGRVPLEKFKEYMKISDVIINLRYPTMGESSASLVRAMSYGKPVIISNINQFRDFPENCCLKIDVGGKEQDMLLYHLIQLKKYPSLRKDIGENARNYIKENHLWESVAKKYLEVFRLIQDDIKLINETESVVFTINIPSQGTIELEGNRNDQSIVQPIINTGIYEINLMRILTKTLKEGSVFLDLGANIGVISVVASKLVGESGTVIAVEAAKANFSYLERNLNRVGLNNYILFNCGAWDCDTTMKFSYVPHVAGCSFFSTTGVQEGEVEVVKCSTADNLLNSTGITRLDLIKIDVEGSELKALCGLDKTIEKFKPDIIFELNTTVLERFFNISQKEIWVFFKEKNYILYQLNNEGLERITSLDKFIRLNEEGEKKWTEIVAKPLLKK